MQNSRVQQVLREARAMVGTVRPQTPAVPPSMGGGLRSSFGGSGSSSSAAATSTTAAPMGGSLNRLGSLTALRNANREAGGGGTTAAAGSSASTAAAPPSSTSSSSAMIPTPPRNTGADQRPSIVGRAAAAAGAGADRLASPPGTPPPEMEMLVSTDREAKGLVGRHTAVGQQWFNTLNSADVRVRHRAIANVFRHCEDELLDKALLTATRGGGGSSSGADTNSSANPSSSPTASGDHHSAINVALLRSEGALAALLVIARNPHIHSPPPSSPTTMSAQSSSTPPPPQSFERLNRVSMILAAAAETEGLESYLVTNGAIQTIGELIQKILGIAATPPTAGNSTPPPAALSVSTPPSPNGTYPFVALLNLLVALRVLSVHYPHHLLKVGLINALLKVFNLATFKMARGEAGSGSSRGGGDAAELELLSSSVTRPTSGAFASRFGFSKTSSSATISDTCFVVSSLIVRIFCQLSFDDDCLVDFKLRKDSLLEPLLLFLGGDRPCSSPSSLTANRVANISPLHDPILAARLMLLISRIVDGEQTLCEDIVEYHWDAVVSKTFECLTKRREIAKMVASVYGAKPSSSESALELRVQRLSFSDDADNKSMDEKSQNDLTFADTITTDAVIAALALLSNVTLIQQGGYSLASSLPHMQCLMSIINSDDVGEEDDGPMSGGGKKKKKSPQTEAARTTVIRYTLIVLSNLSYYLPMMDPLDGDDDNDGEGGDKEEGVNDSPLRGTIVTALALSVCGFLFEGDAEATLEATRILGNLSRTFEGREWMEENGADEALVLFLGHEDHRLVYNCLGVLLNLTSDLGSGEDDFHFPSVCGNAEAVSLLLKHTQRLVSSNSYGWEIKEVVQMLLQNIQRLEEAREAALRNNGSGTSSADNEIEGRDSSVLGESFGNNISNSAAKNAAEDVRGISLGSNQSNDELEALTQ